MQYHLIQEGSIFLPALKLWPPWAEPPGVSWISVLAPEQGLGRRVLYTCSESIGGSHLSIWLRKKRPLLQRDPSTPRASSPHISNNLHSEWLSGKSPSGIKSCLLTYLQVNSLFFSSQEIKAIVSTLGPCLSDLK